MSKFYFLSQQEIQQPQSLSRPTRPTKTAIILTILFLVMIVFLLIWPSSPFNIIKSIGIFQGSTETFKGPFENSDLIMGEEDKPVSGVQFKEGSGYWMGEGYYIYGPVDGDYGVITFPPMSTATERTIGTFLVLEDRVYTLNIKMGNIAGKTYISEATGCDDAIIEIKLLDFVNGEEVLIDNVIVNANEGWLEKSYDLTPFGGDTYYLRIAGIAGGPCGKWNGEWPAISYINLV